MSPERLLSINENVSEKSEMPLAAQYIPLAQEIKQFFASAGLTACN